VFDYILFPIDCLVSQIVGQLLKLTQFLHFIAQIWTPQITITNYFYFSRAAKFANNISESVWETLAQRRLIPRICALFKAYTGGRTSKAIGDRILKPSYLSREVHNRKIRTRKQRTDVGKYSFVNRKIKSRNQLLTELVASCRCKLNTFRKRVKNVVTGKGIEVGIGCK